MLHEASTLYQSRYPSAAFICIKGTEATLPEGHLSRPDLWKAYDMVVYDVDSYSYETILRNLAGTADHDLKLGTWSARTGVLIHESSVITSIPNS